MAHTLTSIQIHVVFSTKKRLRLITLDLKADLFAYMGGIVRELRATAQGINGMEDHVHMLLKLPPDLSISDCMRVVKTNSSRWVRQKFGREFGWQTGFAAFSVSGSKAAEVGRYIRDQERHHRRMTYEQELRALLEKHGIQYDPRASGWIDLSLLPELTPPEFPTHGLRRGLSSLLPLPRLVARCLSGQSFRCTVKMPYSGVVDSASSFASWSPLCANLSFSCWYWFSPCPPSLT